MNETTEAQQDMEPKAITPKEKAPLGFELANVDETWRMSGLLAQSQLLPDTLRGKQSDVLVILLTGRELGLSPMQSIRLISVVKGKPYLEAKLKIALVKRSPVCVFFRLVESTAEKATFETERVGEGKTSLTFTAEDARNAGLLGRATKSGEPDNWQKYTALMLRWRAASQLCDAVYPDIVGGFGTNDEMDEVLREEQAQRIVAPPPPAEPRVVGSSSTSPAPKPAPEKKAEPVQATLIEEPKREEPAPAEEKSAPAEQPAAENPSGDDPDSFADRLMSQMSRAPSLAELTKLAARAQEVPRDLQDTVTKHYTACKAALRARAQAQAGGAR